MAAVKRRCPSRTRTVRCTCCQAASYYQLTIRYDRKRARHAVRCLITAAILSRAARHPCRGGIHTAYCGIHTCVYRSYSHTRYIRYMAIATAYCGIHTCVYRSYSHRHRHSHTNITRTNITRTNITRTRPTRRYTRYIRYMAIATATATATLTSPERARRAVRCPVCCLLVVPISSSTSSPPPPPVLVLTFFCIPRCPNQKRARRTMCCLLV